MKYCQNCGAELKEGKKFCINCGIGKADYGEILEAVDCKSQRGYGGKCFSSDPETLV